MNKIPPFILSVVYLVIFNSVWAQNTLQPNLSPSDSTKIESLMSEMTLEEKIGQLNLFAAGWDVTGPMVGSNDKKLIREGKVGAILNAYTVDYVRDLQRMAVEDSRLKIPLLFGYDVIHGHRTIFPIPLGQACTWDLKMIENAE
ncbi:MAG: glycoside hydrolase family 3 N-terminal domain-containing protein, partial [Bacteroidota bacterium]